MLSAHEFSALFLIHSAPEQISVDHGDVASLIEQHLIVIQSGSAAGHEAFALTDNGLSILRRIQARKGAAMQPNAGK